MWKRQSVSIMCSSKFLINRQHYFLIDTLINLSFAAFMVLQRYRLCYLMNCLLLLQSYLGWPRLLFQVCRLELTFREILGNYKREPQCKPEVFLSIYVGTRNRNGVCTLASISHLLFWLLSHDFGSPYCSFLWHISYQQVLGSRHVDIITFYNEVFVPAAKPFLVSLIASGTRPEDKKNANSMCYTCFLSLDCYFFYE